MAKTKLFGTDGVRGPADELFTDQLVGELGRAAVEALGDQSLRVAILRDTRESGPRIERALAAGCAAAGAHVMLAGVLPTPAASILADHYGFDLVAVISASHNPFADNGVKFFGRDGMKLGDQIEAAIEVAIDQPPRGAGGTGTIAELRGAADDYLRALHQRFAELELSGQRFLLDTANGATYRVAPEIFRRLGAEVEVVFDSPDGRNINDGCGSTHIQALAERVAAGDFAAGFAFDGDGDRVLAVDRAGRIVDGDELIALAAVHLRKQGRLPGNGVAVTVMTNFGFHTAMAAAGVEVAITPVGDRHVLAELLSRGWSLGGEQSGHVIDRGFIASGDGTAAALLTLEALSALGGELADIHAMEKLPQRLVNVRVADREAIAGAASVWSAVEQAERDLAGRGRVLVRPSGTEPLVRVMVEAPGIEETTMICDQLVDLVKHELG